MDTKIFLAVFATVVGIYSYVPYFRDLWRGITKPHAFSWLIWGLLTGIAFFAQLADKGGPGSWVTGFTALVAFVIFIAALFRGEKNITISDWLCLAGAFAALGLWAITDNPLGSVILISIIDFIGFIPTFRKSYKKPYEETLQTYLLSSLKFAIALLALENYSMVTVLYPVSLIVSNGLFVGMLLSRRKLLKDPSDILPV